MSVPPDRPAGRDPPSGHHIDAFCLYHWGNRPSAKKSLGFSADMNHLGA